MSALLESSSVYKVYFTSKSPLNKSWSLLHADLKFCFEKCCLKPYGKLGELFSGPEHEIKDMC